MASIVLGVGSSHGPSLENSPAEWPRLGERDKRDPRFNYQELLKIAKPGLEAQITADVQSARHAAARRSLQQLSEIISGARLDAVVIVSNPHRLRTGNNHPVFGIFRSATFPLERRSEEPFDPDFIFRPERERRKEEIIEAPGQPDLANHLIASLIADGFDVACTDELPQGTTLDEAFAFPREWLFGGASLPSVPFLLSRVLPNQATPQRCYDLGLALRRAIEAWSVDARVGLGILRWSVYRTTPSCLDARLALTSKEIRVGSSRDLKRHRTQL